MNKEDEFIRIIKDNVKETKRGKSKGSIISALKRKYPHVSNKGGK